MAVRIRLKRFGAKKQPTYRLVVADSREARTGKFIEALGYYNPLTEPATIVVDTAKIREWIRKGAQPTDSVRMLLVRAGVWDQIKNGSTPAAGGQAEAGVAEKAAAPSEGATA